MYVCIYCVESIWREAFDNTECLFVANKECTKKG